MGKTLRLVRLKHTLPARRHKKAERGVWTRRLPPPPPFVLVKTAKRDTPPKETPTQTAPPGELKDKTPPFRPILGDGDDPPMPQTLQLDIDWLDEEVQRRAHEEYRRRFAVLFGW